MTNEYFSFLKKKKKKKKSIFQKSCLLHEMKILCMYLLYN